MSILKKSLCFLLAVITSLLCFAPLSTGAATVDIDYVNNKITQLSTIFYDGSFFTRTGTNSCHEKLSYGSDYITCNSLTCPDCNLGNVLKYNEKAANTIVPSVCLRTGRYSCYGFAVFVFCYIFEHDPDINTYSISSSSYGGINNAFLSQLKPGDLLECTKSDGGEHSAIFLSYDSNYIYLYESNFDNPNQVEYNNKRTWDRWVSIKAYRSYTYETSTPVETNDYYLLTAPDGVQTIRNQASTSATAVGEIPSGTIVCVTKYSNDSNWGYVTYNGISGWIRLYYVEKHTAHSYGEWETINGQLVRYCICGASETSEIINDYYLLTAPDGVQTIRSQTTTNSIAVGEIPSGTVVCVTKYSDDKNWGYVTYNGMSGWIRLYYVEKHTTHSYGPWETLKNPTCTSNGQKIRYCICGVSETSVIDANGHSFSSTYTIDIPTTCTTDGSKSQHCTQCTETTNTTIIPALGHQFGEWEMDSQYILFENRSCNSCGHTESRINSQIESTDFHLELIEPNEKVTIKDSYLFGVQTGQAVSEITSLFLNPQYVAVSRNNSDLTPDSSVATGDLVYIKDLFGNIDDSAQIVVLGDITGDGKIAAADYMKIKKSIFDPTQLNELMSIAADINGDGRVAAADYMMVKRHINGSYNIFD